MTRQMLTDLTSRGPGSLVEYQPEPDVEAMSETLVAFANSDGGTLVVGVDAQGRRTGEERQTSPVITVCGNGLRKALGEERRQLLSMFDGMGEAVCKHER